MKLRNLLDEPRLDEVAGMEDILKKFEKMSKEQKIAFMKAAASILLTDYKPVQQTI